MAQTDETYNGWENYPTWCAYTWLTNDEETMSSARETACSTVTASEGGDALKAWIEDCNPMVDLAAGLYTDLLQYAIDKANWTDIARHLRDEAAEEAAFIARQVNGQ